MASWGHNRVMIASLGIAVPALVALIGILLTWQSNKKLAQLTQL